MAIRRDLDTRDQSRDVPSQNRSNQYFVPKEGIDREVITADICRYLGNDALVRPGNYENPLTNTMQAGYYVTAYRNLTSAMIENLKTDSKRWDQERRTANSKGNVGYTQSRTHESRQQWGPTGESNKEDHHLSNLNSETSYPQFSQPTYPPLPTARSPNQQLLPTAFMQQENHYVAGSNMAIEQRRGYYPPIGIEIPRVSVPQYVEVPPAHQYLSQAQSQSYGRGSYCQPLPINNPHLRHQDSNFAAPIVTNPSTLREEKKAFYVQPPNTIPYGNPYEPRNSYNDRNFFDPGQFNQNSISSAVRPSPINQIRRDYVHETDSRDTRNYRDLGRRY